MRNKEIIMDSIKLCDFINGISYFYKKYYVDQIVLLGYYLQKKENFEYFIASEGEVLTNNKLEGFFGATLKKFWKKNRKSLLSFSALLKRKRAKQEGREYFRKFTVFDLTQIFTVLSLFGS